HLTAEELADPVRKAGRYRIPLLNQVAVLGENAEAARARTVRGAVRFLLSQQESLLSVARQDVAALQGWRDTGRQGQVEIDNRSPREYVTSEKFHRFDEALVRLLELLELPGVGKVVSGALYVLRTPYRLIRGWVSKAVTRPEARSMPELPVLEEALAGWLDL